MSTTLPTWVGNFFDGFYAQCDLRWPVEHQKHVASNLMKLLKLQPGDSVFDQCCGEGYLAEGLANEGCRVCGVDQSQRYIDKARALVPNGCFVCGDAGVYQPPQMQGAVNWHTSLGYGGPVGALLLLQRLNGALLPHKRLVIDVRNVEVYRTQPLVQSETLETKQWGTVQLTREGQWRGNSLTQHWTALQNGQVVWQQRDAECFHPSLANIDDLFSRVGIKRVETLGAFDETFDVHSHPRLIVVGERTWA